MKYIYVGKIVNTHGIKGEVRILSDFKYNDKVFVKGFNIYIGKNKDNKIINSYRYHKIFDMITMVGINNIQDVLVYKGRDVFVNRDDLVLDDDQKKILMSSLRWAPDSNIHPTDRFYLSVNGVC